MIRISRVGSTPSRPGPEDYFSGRVRLDSPFQADMPARTGGATVTFDPGARTAWHTHPLGQTLIVIAGTGWVQQWGQARQDIHPGDIIWIAPQVKHWHGATADTGMSHLAIAEQLDGNAVEWMEQVTEAQYLAGSAEP